MLTFKNPHQLFCMWAEVRAFEELEHWPPCRGRSHVGRPRPCLDGHAPREPRGSRRWRQSSFKTFCEKAVQDSGDRSSDRFKQARLDSWTQLIDAKEQLEKRLEEPNPLHANRSLRNRVRPGDQYLAHGCFPGSREAGPSSG